MKNIVLCYEPGAGGDFLATLLSYSNDIFGDNAIIEHHSSGRIKTRGLVEISLIDDYEYFDNTTNTISEMMTLQNFNATISKVHPYLLKNTPEFLDKINTVYSNSTKIMLHRDPKLCFLNDQIKNAENPILNNIEKSLEYYTNDWYTCYEKIKINTDIIDIQFEDLISNPIRTIASVCEYANIRPNISDNFIETYKKYISNQTYIETVKRFWT
jgi:hypothetical protein